MLLECVEGCRWLATTLLLSLLILHASASDSNFNCVAGLDSPGATIPKGDILLEEGSSLEIFCNLNISHKEAFGRNASNLVFYRNDKKVSPEFVEVINATTIRLFKKTPPASTGYYYCKLDIATNVTGICLNMVAIGYKPQEVKDFSCISHNWQNLTCRWIKPENPIKTIYKLHFYLPGRAGKRMLYSCPDEKNDKKSSTLKRNLQKNEEMCFWDLTTQPHYRQPYEYYYFEMKGSNKLGEAKFEPIKFHHYSHVIPSPPEQLTVVNTTINSAFLSWDVPFPMQIFPPGVHHRMVYQSTYDNSDRWHVANTSYLSNHKKNHTYNLTDLRYANTLYDIRVYLRSAFAVGDDKWSHHASITFKTESTVPGAPPETVIGSFETIPEGVTRDVYVYWRQVPRYLHNGDKFDYKVVYVKENGIGKNLEYNHTPAYARFKGLTYNTYEFSIVSTNNVGDSITSSVVHVPSKEDMPKEPVSFTKIAFHDGIYELSWKAPSESPDIDSYTIFWCSNGRDRPYQCTGLLNWTVVPANVTLKNITVPDETKIYQFAISANTKNASSGMVWASCTVIHNKVVDKMKSVWINRIGSSFIEVGWKLECSDRIGRVEGFEIGFCPILSPRETACKEPKQSLRLEPSERQFHGNVTGLRPYTTYMVTIAILTNNGKGTPSDPLFNTTMEAAPDSPTNVSVTDVTNKSVVVHWQPPASMNGVLRFYQILYNNSSVKVDRQNTTMYTLDDLASYTSYKISIVACTVECSEPSNPVEVRTRIGNPGQANRPRPKFLNDSLVVVSWEPPKEEEWGGKLDYYVVSVQQSDGARKNSTYLYNSTETSSQIPIPECSKDQSRVKYTFWVRAVNIGEKNQSYFGPWSDPGETTCYSSGPSLPVKITIYVVCFLLVSALCIGLGCVGKRVWICCKEMQQVEVKLPPGLAPAGDKEKDQDFPIDVTWTSGHHDHTLTGGKVRPSADEELLLKKKEKKEERHGRNPSGDSSGCSSGHESVSSSLTSGTQISSDSGTEVDQRPPSPDGVFEETTPWDRASLRLRKASSSVARSTPNLSDVEGLSSSHCVGAGAWSSTGYISMPSSEEVGSGGGEGTSYCRVGLEASPAGVAGVVQLPQVQTQQSAQLPVVKGYVVLPPGTSAGTLSPLMQHPTSTSASTLGPGPQPVTHGYVSHQMPWTSPKESPNKAYVMAGELGDMAANKTSPSLMVMGIDDDQSILDVDVLEDAQTPDSYCRLGLCSVPPVGVTSPDGEGNMIKPSSGYVTLGEGSHSSGMMSAGRESTTAQGSRVGGTSGYVPHRHFEKRNTIPLSSAFTEQADDSSYTNMIPTSSGETKSPTTNV